MDIEFCVQSHEETLVAQKYKVKRIELCKSLIEGGLTPDKEVVKACSAVTDVETHVLIRPRPGNFNYAENEILQMKLDIQMAKQNGAAGVVFGVLDKHNSIDIEINASLIKIAKHLDLETTFHRAFDSARQKHKAIVNLVQLEFDRVLTSGGKPSAADAVDLLEELVRITNHKIEIMAGGNITSVNAHTFHNSIIHALHFSISNYRDEGADLVIDEEKIKGILKAVF